jgi:tol-pal system protein YbgF
LSIDKRRNERFGILTALLLGGALGCQPGAPSPVVESEISVLNSKADYLNLRMNKMEKSIEAMGRTTEETEKSSRQGRADLSVSIEDLRTEIKSLNGTIGILRHDLDELSKSNQKVKEDFDTRLTELDQKFSDLAQQVDRSQTAAKSPRGKIEPGNEVARYNQILALLQKKRSYDAAIDQFRNFIRESPQSPLAANAQYWIGEGYYAKADYARAISEYQVVVEKYPHGEKLCDALLKQGFAFSELKESGKSKLFLLEVQDRCPKTPAATKAAERLAKLAPAESKQ